MSWLKPFIHWGFLFVQLAVAVLALACWRKTKSLIWKLFILVWVLTFWVEAAGKIMGSYGIHNLWLYNLFYAVFYPALVLFFAMVFDKKNQQRLIVAVGLCLFVWAIGGLLAGNNQSLNTGYITASCTIIIFLSLCYLVHLFLDKETTTPLRNDYYYWISTGFVFYFAYTAVMEGMYTKIIESKNPWLPYFIFYASHAISLLLYFFLWRGFRAAHKWMK